MSITASQISSRMHFGTGSEHILGSHFPSSLSSSARLVTQWVRVHKTVKADFIVLRSYKSVLRAVKAGRCLEYRELCCYQM